MMPVTVLAFTGFTEENCRNSQWGYQIPWQLFKPRVSPGTSSYNSTALPIHQPVRYVIFRLQGHKYVHHNILEHVMGLKASSSGGSAICLKICRYY